MIGSENTGVLVSYIENKGNRYIIIVNHDVFKKQKIKIKLKENKEVRNLTGKENKIYTWKKEVGLTLDKGGYVILKEI